MPGITLNLAKGNSHYCSGRLSVGVYVKDKKATLIDSGIDTAGAKSVYKKLQAMGYTVSSIINTHSHADHCGGNNFFQKQNKNLKIYATKYEKAFIEIPYMEPLCFCGGAAPFSDLRNKHLEAVSSTVTNTIEPYKDQAIDIDGEKFSIITLPGHTPGMIGVITPDNILYCGDAIFGEDTFDKHGILFYTNIKDTLDSFKKLRSLEIDGCVFYHGAFVKDISLITDKHAEQVLKTKAFILELLQTVPMSVDLLTSLVIKKLKIPENVMQFTLTRTCVNAYITQLQLEKEVIIAMDNGLQIIKALRPLGDINVMSNLKEEKKEQEQKHEQKYEQEYQVAELSALERFKLIQEKSEKFNNISLEFYYKPDYKLKGEMHLDGAILIAAEFILDFMRGKGLVKNEVAVVMGENYKGNAINYKERNFTPANLSKECEGKITSIELYEHHFKIMLDTNSSDEISKFSKILSTELENLGLPNETLALQLQFKM